MLATRWIKPSTASLNVTPIVCQPLAIKPP